MDWVSLLLPDAVGASQFLHIAVMASDVGSLPSRTIAQLLDSFLDNTQVIGPVLGVNC